ncbi:23S rRNA (cytidine(2498)-2'-O)-methyltransferase RlmM [Xanthomonas sp. XNM01]|uniref:23S rRNA (cytidine(2498)-2'-O)-methyltransferase RlmM n=1 Tax=Xanthomonas sp. XNM01 TaxID=2769289 RepID=UPI00177E859D|nr:23S rRNA (cytidine(2498)-2'-O)-methyltransferase RlmM [Xanthomonas sp. XNM01]MBD9367370.1 23S rRNA (cytidine(2498)-2'-O)-methyltransferase RlmM [Xanthomonas sp. XNM01]
MSPAHGLLCYCRAGFEPELAAELTERAALAGVAGYARTRRDDGHVLFLCGDAADGAALARSLAFRDLVFARQKLQLLAELQGLDPKDRITPLLAALPAGLRVSDVWVEHPDSDAGKPLSGLARSFGNALRPALRKAGHLAQDARLPRLHICFLDGDHALLALADTHDASPLPQGIPRLKLLPEAPSRSALKLEEALMTMLEPGERERLMRAGMTAADLGAAPGGWTWVLTRQHLRVSSIDNGPLRQHVLDTGLVEHLRADGFRWRPASPLDWMVCDMVEQPVRVASRMAEWFREGWCRHAIFNLKLPMKKRWQETRLCLDLFEREAGRRLTVRARQLYHDREEITVLASPDL